MSAVEGWENKKLIELAEYINGYAFKPDDWGKDGLPIIRIEQLKNPDASTDYYSGKVPTKNIIENGDLIFSWSASLFLRIWRHDRAALNQHLFRVVEREGVDRVFLKLFIEFYLPELVKASHGSTMQHITRKELDRFGAPFPTYKPEQTKIAEILSTVDRAIEQTEALIAKQQRIKTGLMQDLLTRGIDEHGNLRSEQTHEFKDSPLGRIPVEWEVTDWGSVGYWKGGSTPSKGDPKNWINGRNLWVSPKDIRAPILETTEDLLTDRALTVSKLHVFQAGSIFTVFRSGILKHTIPISTCSKAFSVNQDIKVLIPKSETNIKFLKYLLSYCSPDILRKAVKAGTTVESIDRLVFEEMKIPCPDLPEQTRISDVLGQQESTSITLKSELLKLRSLKTAFMQDLLTGKKRVTTLLNDTEVASV